MSAAQHEVVQVDEEAGEFRLTECGQTGLEQAGPRAELKRQVAERLAAHRRRRGGAVGQVDEVESAPVGAVAGRGGRRQSAAAAVAERYAQTPSYRAFLAEQAQRAVEEAEAAAEVARRNAAAVAAVQQELLTELELWEAPQEFRAPDAVVISNAGAGLTVRLYEDLGAPESRQAHAGRGEAVVNAAVLDAADMREVQALEAEIDFRKSPVFEDYRALLERNAEPTVELPANLLEFPRQLVAARRARPRLAEGPLREEGPRTQQLRIFEVEAEQISTAPVMAEAAEWTSIRLGAATVARAASPENPQIAVMAQQMPPQTAPTSLRLMAWLLDAGLVLAALVMFVAAFVKLTGELPVGPAAWIALGCTGAVLSLLYELLFFTFSEQTPGMRYARIGLCTFSDENPTRGAIRRRILAQLVAAVPAGLGLVWALLDEDGLGWHDRISRMYPRAY